MRRAVKWGLIGLLFAVAALYAADWGVMRWQMAHGRAFETVMVRQVLATSLKGNKEEYDYMGEVAVQCSRSIFPQAGDTPCWWQARHLTQWQ